ncbi:hypothetical protein ACL7TT_01475 [Microbulbifer sp. 2304DJ12-6]|uniref:hypothetical protein n=1 Tax=Microbulbifer sp. 2304DJ12-6 TaxID=3233340 RepID=UPI0039AEC981
MGALDSAINGVRDQRQGANYGRGGVYFDGSAENTLARIYRAEWQDYLNRFAPYEDKAIDFATNPEAVTEAVDRAGSAMEQSFATSKESLQRDRSRYGLSMSPREQASESRSNAASGTAAKLAARNNTRLHVQDRQQQVMSGAGAVGLREAISEGR